LTKFLFEGGFDQNVSSIYFQEYQQEFFGALLGLPGNIWCIHPNVAKAGGLQSPRQRDFAALNKATEGEVVVLYFESSATQNLKFFGFPEG
jgi:hypothetical protein